MEKYRFKKVYTNGEHRFVGIRNTEFGAFVDAMICHDDGLDHIDVYLDSKLIATFYK